MKKLVTPLLKQTATIRLTPEQIKEVDDAADKQEKSRSLFMEQAVLAAARKVNGKA